MPLAAYGYTRVSDQLAGGPGAEAGGPASCHRSECERGVWSCCIVYLGQQRRLRSHPPPPGVDTRTPSNVGTQGEVLVTTSSTAQSVRLGLLITDGASDREGWSIVSRRRRHTSTPKRRDDGERRPCLRSVRRRLISQRTKAALASTLEGVRLGRPRSVPAHWRSHSCDACRRAELPSHRRAQLRECADRQGVADGTHRQYAAPSSSDERPPTHHPHTTSPSQWQSESVPTHAAPTTSVTMGTLTTVQNTETCHEREVDEGTACFLGLGAGAREPPRRHRHLPAAIRVSAITADWLACTLAR